LAKKNPRILILEDDACFREMLESLCREVGETVVVADKETALGLLSEQTFQLILLDWHLCRTDSRAILSMILHFQPNARWIALFTVPDLNNVKAAMKAGASDVLWPIPEGRVIQDKLMDILAQKKPAAFSHSTLNRLADSLTEKALAQKSSLSKARREFSKSFLEQVLSQKKLRRSELASLMHVSSRTLNRHLSA
jgi:DNA-binding NtrC family response regulator